MVCVRVDTVCHEHQLTCRAPRCVIVRGQLKGLGNGYHLMRAFVVDPSGACVKSPLAYVEAEFYAVDTTMPEERCVAWVCRCRRHSRAHDCAGWRGHRGYMFGQPSLCHVAPRRTVHKTADGGVLVDVFPHNCMLGEGAAG